MDNIAYISQDNYLFDETVLENIRMGKPSETDEEVYQAEMCIRDRVLSLAMKFFRVLNYSIMIFT